jgi:hypothetical protein
MMLNADCIQDDIQRKTSGKELLMFCRLFLKRILKFEQSDTGCHYQTKVLCNSEYGRLIVDTL